MGKDSKKQRQSFTFYLSFHKAIKELKMRDRVHIYDAIVEYALMGNEPENLSAMSQLVWDLIEPTLSKSRTNYLNGCKTLHPKKTQAETTSAANKSLPGQQSSETASTYTDSETNTNTDTNTDTKPNTYSHNRAHIHPQGAYSGSRKSPQEIVEEYLLHVRSDVMRKAIREWLEYKIERGEAYRSLISIHKFCMQLKELCDGKENRAIQILSNSIANNWSKIYPLNDGYVPESQRGEGYMRGYA